MAKRKTSKASYRKRRQQAALKKAGRAIDEIIAGAKALAEAEKAYYGRGGGRAEPLGTILGRGDGDE